MAVRRRKPLGRFQRCYGNMFSIIRSIPNFVNESDQEQRFDKVVIGNSGAAGNETTRPLTRPLNY